MTRVAALLVGLLASAAPFAVRNASAQDFRQPGRFELAGGVAWTGSSQIGTTDANLTTGTGNAFRLFSTSTELTPTLGIEARFAAQITRLIEAEVQVGYSRPQLRTTISGDTEASGVATATEKIEQFRIEAAGIVAIPRRLAGRGTVFLSGGGGYLRELPEDRTLVQTGRIYHVGAGVKWPLVTRPSRAAVKQVGIRGDVRALFRSGGVNLDNQTHAAPGAVASLYARF